MRTGVALQPVYPSAQFGDMVTEIERLGFDEFWLTDSSLHSKYSPMYLAIAAMRTARMTLGNAVTNPVTRHPALGAVAAATLNEMSGGRAVYGLGAGDRPLLALGLRPAKLALLEDAIVAARELWTGATVTRQYRGFALDDAHMRFDVPTEIPVWISASGPKTLELAGRVADGVVLLAGLHPDGLRYALEHIDRGVQQAGRTERPKISVFGYGAVDDDRERALAAARTIAAWFPQTAPVYCELAGLDPALIERVRGMYQGGEFQEAAKAAALLPEDFVHRMSLSGDKAAVAEHITNLEALGVDGFTVFPLGGDADYRMATVAQFASCFPAPAATA
ncbi:LLM class flavin-dependent oxidoreductase [Nakamurella leprariae]|uniref:LLM class flavin-dependent oxidoreductase n=1 Tax=Nakamurella leprariae TaxID=2803911 RepID=A0A938YFL9_9ACTN|nr:LLM class flavin-dependent oxidoreductase [Nakamurella leprariae]MBM9468688.1 LLM class flavin-dependent oxidoreductase [Nakamurella leprariae]